MSGSDGSGLKGEAHSVNNAGHAVLRTTGRPREISVLLNIGAGKIQVVETRKEGYGVAQKLKRDPSPDEPSNRGPTNRKIRFSTTALLHFFLPDRVFDRDS